MASIVNGRGQNWEIRESVRTPRGPRSRTLATFRRLDGETIERARARAKAPLTAAELVSNAKRVGAPLAPNAADEAAIQLLRELREGRRPRAGLRRLVVEHLGEQPQPSDAIGSAAEWAGASPQERGAALRDLLLLADALPVSQRAGGELRFPPLARAMT